MPVCGCVCFGRNECHFDSFQWGNMVWCQRVLSYRTNETTISRQPKFYFSPRAFYIRIYTSTDGVNFCNPWIVLISTNEKPSAKANMKLTSLQSSGLVSRQRGGKSSPKQFVPCDVREWLLWRKTMPSSSRSMSLNQSFPSVLLKSFEKSPSCIHLCSPFTYSIVMCP